MSKNKNKKYFFDTLTHTSNLEKFSRKTILVVILFASVGLLLVTQTVIAEENSKLIPSWIKFTAGVWAGNEISDYEFINAIEWLINQRIMVLQDPIHYQIVIETEGGEVAPFYMNTEIVSVKISHLKDLAKNPTLQEQLREENKKFEKMGEQNRLDFIQQKEIEWVSTPKAKLTPFMKSKINNLISDQLRENLVIHHEKYGELRFGEFIITNVYGGNFATTVRTDNYDQSVEKWWQLAKKHGIVIRHPSWDESADMISSDINIRIEDDSGNLLGILNAATPPE
ncbi:MAG: hypothetical protein OER78_02325 [Nitrosopumilus sp.]|nr:hypothetical protein [Nitrosopumilus sp.]